MSEDVPITKENNGGSVAEYMCMRDTPALLSSEDGTEYLFMA